MATVLLGEVYNDLNNPWLAEARARDPSIDPSSRPNLSNFRPEHKGYGPTKVPREFAAEAIRAYLTDPNYLKTTASEVAAAIRATYNDHPDISRFIQFNALAPFGAGLLPSASRTPANPKSTYDNSGSNAMHLPSPSCFAIRGSAKPSSARWPRVAAAAIR